MYFENKTVLITGAAAGIGRATAIEAAARGAALVIVDVQFEAAAQTAAEIESKGGKARAHACDISDDAAVAALAAAVLAKHKTPDILINNAYSRALSLGNLDNIDLDQWKRAFDVNVLGFVRTTRAFLPAMIANGHGYIVDTSSSLAIAPVAATQHLLPYMATKGAILGLAYGLAHALKARGLQYSVFCPGLTASRGPAGQRPTDSGMHQGVPAHLAVAAPPEFAAKTLLDGIERGDFLISSEPNFERQIVRFAQNKLDPFSNFGE